MSESSNSSGAIGGVGFLGLLQLAFIILKLCKVITWSWWLVFTPLFFEIFLLIVAFVILVIVEYRKSNLRR